MKTPLALFALFALPTIALADADPQRPDPIKTPGMVRTTDLAQICGTKTSTVRNVTQADKDATFAAYKLAQRHDPSCTGPGNACYEIDHLISLELGGDNTPKNRWPQPYDTPMNAHMKDKLENELHRRVCLTHQLTPTQAQSMISTDWITTYRTIFGNQ